MRKSLLLLGLVLLMLIPSAAYASSSIAGKATSCSSFAACNYTISNTTGTGSASANAGVSGSVGQNFTFYGGSLSFQLPGETGTSYDTGVYSGVAINTGVFNVVAGLVYHITGSFAAPDNNNGKIVKGTTKGYVGIKGHSGRGGGNTFTLLNGTISFNPTNLDATLMTVTCNPTSFLSGTSTTCTASVTDLASSTSFPTGRVTFSSTLGFNPTKCSLSSGSCSVQITPAAGTWPVYASYTGDKLHYMSSAQGPELYVGCPPDGC